MYKLTNTKTIIRQCSVDGCEKNHAAKGFCKKHYERFIKHGSPEETATSYVKGLPVKEHFMFYFEKSNKTEVGCIEWAGSIDVCGYGRIAKSNCTYKAHRLSYTYFKGDIPDGYEICHKCDNPKCINPDHLFAGTTKDNAIDRERKNRGNHHLRAKTFVFVRPDGAIQYVNNLTRFCAAHELSQPKMSEVAAGNRPQHKGWTRYV
jgi:hypothetical protein